MTHPLLDQLGLSRRAGVVIGGDTLPRRKPDPLPLTVAADRLGVDCSRCLYLGDDQRDIVAGKAAGMKTMVAAWGYIESNIDYRSWEADAEIDHPLDLIEHAWLNAHENT